MCFRPATFSRNCAACGASCAETDEVCPKCGEKLQDISAFKSTGVPSVPGAPKAPSAPAVPGPPPVPPKA